ncbi:MAG: ABC transporter substrate-binding protein [bacterium]|nr:ABC transporter substrate-binding protein [bacterium]
MNEKDSSAAAENHSTTLPDSEKNDAQKKKLSFFSRRKKNTNNKNTNFDKELVYSLNKSKVPSLRQLKYTGHFLNKREKNIIRISAAVMFMSLIFLTARAYVIHVKEVPASGGNYTENLTGSPKFINPLYSSINTVDSDITSLVFSGLLKRNKENELVSDLAEKFTMSEDETSYTFFLKKDILWHDGESFTANDVIFTYQTIINNSYKSPLKISYDGVLAEYVDDYTVKFTLPEPYAAFLDLLTIGIIPIHIWQQIPSTTANLSELNLEPIGTGPYKYQSFTKDKKTGVIRSYTLAANDKYYGQVPYITELIFRFSPNFIESINAINGGGVEGTDYLPKDQKNNVIALNNYNLHYLSQPQLTALFFNQNKLASLESKNVRQALAYALDKNELIAAENKENTQVIDSPILPVFEDYQSPDLTKYEYNVAKANELLDAAGWKIVEVAEPIYKKVEAEPAPTSEGEVIDEEKTVAAEPELIIEAGAWRQKGGEYLQFTLSIVDQPDTIEVAEKLRLFWQDINVKVNIEPTAPESFQRDVIKTRDYQVMLFGAILGADPDQYAFWHSSQIGANGLNLANYNNKKTDELIEDGRITNNVEIRRQKYNEFQKIISDELPAIFLFSQKYPYLQTKKINGFDVKSIIVSSDRFSNISEWYIKTKKKFVW